MLLPLMALAAVAASSSGRVTPVVCGERCVEAGHCCEGNISGCAAPSCAMGCLFADLAGTPAQCNASCTAAQGKCNFATGGSTFGLCGMCPQLPTDCGCPAPGECGLGCALAFGAPVPNPQPPPPPPQPPLPPCSTPYNCSLNGACVGGACHCDQGWTGRYCSQLDLLPVVNGSGLQQLRGPGSAGRKTSTWGGTVLYDNETGTWHMWAAEMLHHCGIHRWVTNSVVSHATSTSPDGTYTRQDQPFPLFTHEPTATRGPSGEFVIYVTHHKGTPAGSGTTCTCTDGNSRSGSLGGTSCINEVPNCDWNRDPQIKPILTNCTMITMMSWAKNPNGPWSPLVPLTFQSNPYSDSNFAPIIFADGSLLGWTRSSIVRASDWRKVETYKDTGGALRDGLGFGIGEDPYLWRDRRRGGYHILSHGGAVRGGPWIGPHGDCGRHFFSETGDAGTWDAAPLHPDEDGGCAYFRADVRFSDGERRTFWRRERPHLIFAADGETLAALTTGTIDSPTNPVSNFRHTALQL